MSVLRPSETVVEEYRVVRNDGVAIPTAYPGDLRAAKATLADRERNGKRAPYRIQQRRITYGAWEDRDA